MGTVIYLLMSMVGVCLTSIFAPSVQRRLYGVSPHYFVRVKIKKSFVFMFRGIGEEGCMLRDVRRYGIARPLFILQLAGHILAVLLLVALLVLYFAFDIELNIIGLLSMSVFVCFSIIASIVIFWVTYESKRRVWNHKKG